MLVRESSRSLSRFFRRVRFSQFHEGPDRRQSGARWPGWELVVGIEVHAQIKSRRKLFSDTMICGLTDTPNSRVSLFDAAFPGTLPKLNPNCVELAIRTAIALNADIQRRSSFDRKHYFYSDLPAGYQITQYYAPVAKGGYIKMDGGNATIRIKQIQLEQDTAKSMHDDVRKMTQVDLNRAGAALLEIVSEPDIRTSQQAGGYILALQALLRAVGACDGNMERGSMRCDVNVSVNRPGEPPGTRCEIKNLNSASFTAMAVTSEALRHIQLLERGERVPSETRGFDEDRKETFKLRSKEAAPEYRYMPDPNLPPLLLPENLIDSIRREMPELPDATRTRLQAQGLTARDADVLMCIDEGREVGFDGEVVGNGAVAYFDKLSRGRDPQVVANWMIHELLGQNANFQDNSVTVFQMGGLIDLVQSKKITRASGKNILRHIVTQRSEDSPEKIMNDLSLGAITEDDVVSLQNFCEKAIIELPQEADLVRNGNLRVLDKLVGRVIKLSRRRADPRSVRTMLEKALKCE